MATKPIVPPDNDARGARASPPNKLERGHKVPPDRDKIPTPLAKVAKWQEPRTVTRVCAFPIGGMKGVRPQGVLGDMIQSMASKLPSKSAPSVDDARLRQQAIGAKLRQMFDEVVNEPVPDEFLEILHQADARNSGND